MLHSTRPLPGAPNETQVKPAPFTRNLFFGLSYLTCLVIHFLSFPFHPPFLRHLLLSNAHIDTSQNPCNSKDAKHAKRNDNRLPVSRRPGVIVRHNELAVPELIYQVDSRQGQRGATNRVHEGLVKRRLVAHNRDRRRELYILGALGEDNAQVDARVRDAFCRAGTLKEGYFEDIGLASCELAQVRGQVGIPAHAEAVLPRSKDGISRLQFQQSLLVPRAELGRRHIANVVGKVWVYCAGSKRDDEALERRRGWVQVVLSLPLDAREVVLKTSTQIHEPVALFRGQVTAPVRDLNVTLQEGGMCDGLGELVAHAHELLGACRNIVVETIGEDCALLLGIGLLLFIELGRERRIVWDIDIGELDLGSLFLRQVG